MKRNARSYEQTIPQTESELKPKIKTKTKTKHLPSSPVNPKSQNTLETIKIEKQISIIQPFSPNTKKSPIGRDYRVLTSGFQFIK